MVSRDEILAMLADRHPDGLKVPPAMAIAHHLISAAVNRLVVFAAGPAGELGAHRRAPVDADHPKIGGEELQFLQRQPHQRSDG
jgi:hypothetical protein